LPLEFLKSRAQALVIEAEVCARDAQEGSGGRGCASTALFVA
jgi:hypothetical protein